MTFNRYLNIEQPFSDFAWSATPPTSAFEVSDPDLRVQLVELYKLYYTLFFNKNRIDKSYFELPNNAKCWIGSEIPVLRIANNLIAYFIYKILMTEELKRGVPQK